MYLNRELLVTGEFQLLHTLARQTQEDKVLPSVLDHRFIHLQWNTYQLTLKEFE